MSHNSVILMSVRMHLIIDFAAKENSLGILAMRDVARPRRETRDAAASLRLSLIMDNNCQRLDKDNSDTAQNHDSITRLIPVKTGKGR